MADLPRDSQAKKVWAAEDALSQPRFSSGNERMAFAEPIVRSRWWTSRVKLTERPRKTPAMIFTRQSRCDAWVDGPTVYLSDPRNTNALYVCHALAHLVEPPSTEQAWHSPAFGRAYLALVKRFMDDGTEQLLRSTFRMHKVKLRTVSAEAREGMRERYMERQEEQLEGKLKDLLGRLEKP